MQATRPLTVRVRDIARWGMLPDGAAREYLTNAAPQQEETSVPDASAEEDPQAMATAAETRPNLVVDADTESQILEIIRGSHSLGVARSAIAAKLAVAPVDVTLHLQRLAGKHQIRRIGAGRSARYITVDHSPSASAETEREARRNTLLNLLHNHDGYLTRTEIMQRLPEFTLQQVIQALRTLRQQGQVTEHLTMGWRAVTPAEQRASATAPEAAPPEAVAKSTPVSATVTAEKPSERMVVQCGDWDIELTVRAAPSRDEVRRLIRIIGQTIFGE